MRVFLAGATGVIGIRLVPLLTAAGHTVAGLTRTPAKAAALARLGAEPVVCDVYDTAALGDAVLAAGGVVLRYGRFYGPGTYFERELPDHPRIHVDEAARRTVPALGLSRTIVTIAEEGGPGE
jgi:uncharacterized protein YbjT (DUF2867 family)